MQFFDRPSTLPPLGLPIRIEAEDARGFDDRTGNSGTSEHSEESGDDESDESDDEGARKVSKLAPPALAPISTEVKSRSGGIDELLAAEIDEIRTKKKVSTNTDSLSCVTRPSPIREVTLVFQV